MTDGATYTMPFTDPVIQRVLQVTLLVLVSTAVLLSGTGKTALHHRDEARYCLISKNMVENGNFLEPTLNGEPYFDKPPLYFWLTALSFKLLGATSFSARLVLVLGAALTLIATYLIASSLFNHPLGLIATACLATSLMFIGFGKFVRMDIYLTAFIAFAIWGFIKGYQHPEQRWWYLIMYVAVALALLTKGPIGALIPAVVIGLFLVIQFMFVKADVPIGERVWLLMATVGRMKLILGLVILIVLAGPWFLYMQIIHPTFWREFFVKHNAERFGFGGWNPFGHEETPLIYLAVLIVGMLPWTPAVLLALGRYIGPAFRRARNDGAAQILIIWALFILVFFSFSATKLVHYVLPMIVPLAILTGRYFYDYWQSDFPKRRRHVTLAWAYPAGLASSTIVVGMLVLGAALAVWVRFRFRWTNLPDLFAPGVVGQFGWLISMSYRLLAAVIVAKVFLFFLRRRELERLAWSIAIVVLLFTVDLSHTEMPRVFDALSDRRLIPAILSATSEDDLILAGPEERWSLPFYLEGRRDFKQIDNIADLSDDRRFSGRIVYLSTDETSYRQSPWFPRTRITVLHELAPQETRLLLVRPAIPTTQPAKPDSPSLKATPRGPG